jgi:hypothetical protein
MVSQRPDRGTSARGRWVATAVAAGVVALSTGIVSFEGSRSPDPADRAMGAPVLAVATPTPSASAAVLAPSTRAAPVDVPVFGRPAVPDASAAVAPATPEGGVLRAPARARQHRVYDDGREIGEGPGAYVVPCGAHTVRVGSHGAEQAIDVPCGGAVDVE